MSDPVVVAALVPLAGLLVALAVLFGGRAAQVLAIVAAVLAGVALLLAVIR